MKIFFILNISSKILYFRLAQLQSVQLMMTVLKHHIRLKEVLMMILVTMLLLDTNQMLLLVMVTVTTVTMMAMTMMAMIKLENVARN